MGYVAYTGNTMAAVTTDNKSTIAIACPTSTHVQWQTADVTVLTPSLPGAASVATVYDVTGPASNDTTYVAKVIVNPTYQVGKTWQLYNHEVVPNAAVGVHVSDNVLLCKTCSCLLYLACLSVLVIMKLWSMDQRLISLASCVCSVLTMLAILFT